MSSNDPVALLFGGMEKLGPGGNVHTTHVLSLLPKRKFGVIVDAGCGTGRQTLVLAKELRVPVHAVDSHEPFLAELKRRASEANVDSLVRAYWMDMKDIPAVFRSIDLLWSEGAAYNIGFAAALSTWASAIAPGGFAVVSELCWLKTQPPGVAVDFFRTCYPDMKSVPQNVAIARDTGFKVLTTYTLPGKAWVEGYYDVLEPRARELAGHHDQAVRDFAAETIREIEVFRASGGSYGYVFLVLQRT